MKRLAMLAAVLLIAACGSSENATVEDTTEVITPATSMSPDDSFAVDSIVDSVEAEVEVVEVE